MAHHDDVPPELRSVAAHLDQERPELASDDLERVRRRTMARVAANRAPVRSRFAVAGALTLGLVLSGGGAAMGVSALTTSPSASVAQYGTTTTTTTTSTTTSTTSTTSTNAVVPQSQGTPPGPAIEGVAETGGDEEPTLGGREPSAEEADAQAPRQLEAGADAADELPFTGYAAIPVLLLGLALLVLGVVLRRRSAAGMQPGV